MNEQFFHWLITSGIGLIGFLFWSYSNLQSNQIKKDIQDAKNEIEKFSVETKKEMDMLWKEINEFKLNYLDRFEKVNKNINASRESILEMIHQMDKKIK